MDILKQVYNSDFLVCGFGIVLLHILNFSKELYSINILCYFFTKQIESIKPIRLNLQDFSFPFYI